MHISDWSSTCALPSIRPSAIARRKKAAICSGIGLFSARSTWNTLQTGKASAISWPYMESDFGTHDTTKRRVSEPEFLCPDGSRPMYVPPAFRLDDRAAAIEVMRVHPFAMLAAATGPGAVEITHLPILVDRDGEVVTLRGHVARAKDRKSTRLNSSH